MFLILCWIGLRLVGEIAQLKRQLARVAYKLRGTNEEYKSALQKCEQQAVTMTRLSAENAAFKEMKQQIDDAARKSALVGTHDAHRRIARTNEKLKLAVQRQNGLLREVQIRVCQKILSCLARCAWSKLGYLGTVFVWNAASTNVFAISSRTALFWN